MLASIAYSVVLSQFAAANPYYAPISAEELTRLIDILKTPEKPYRDPALGPRIGEPLRYGYTLRGKEVTRIACSLKVDRRPIYDLLADKTQHGQARARAGAIIVEWHLGSGYLFQPEKETIEALRAALKGPDVTLKWGILACLGK